MKVARPALLAIIGAALLSGCNENRFGLPAPDSTQANSVLHLWRFSLYTATALGAGIFLFLFYSIVRHRRKNDELPKQTEGSIPLEIAWTVIPFIIVTVLFVVGLKAQADVTALKPNPPLYVNVTGYQWNWRFNYPAQNVTVAGDQVEDIQDTSTFPTMVLPVNERVRFNLVSADVNHAFFVPNFLTKRDLIPGVRNVIDITPDHIGTYVGHCAEFCGLNHSQMNFNVRVVSQADFQTWIQQQQQQAAQELAQQQAAQKAQQQSVPTPLLQAPAPQEVGNS